MQAHIVTAFKAARHVHGVTITYRRGADTVSLSALPGSSLFGFITDEQGVTRDELHSEDFIILASELILDGSQVTPERYDEIDIDGRTVVALDDAGDAYWRYADQYRATIRVRCKGVS